MQAFLLRKGCSTAADSMGDIIDPVRPTLAYANLGCEVSLRLFWAYAGKGSVIHPPSGTGLFHHPAPPSMSEEGRDGLHYENRRSTTGPDVPPLSPPLPPPGPSSVHHHHHHHQHRSGSPDGENSAKRRRAGSGAGSAAVWPPAPSHASELGRRTQGSAQADTRGMPRDGGGAGRGSVGNDGDRETDVGASHEDGGMPLYDIPFPAGTKFANSGSIAPDVDGEQHALAFDLVSPGGADAFFHLGQNTDIAMAATPERVGQLGSEIGSMGGGAGSGAAAGKGRAVRSRSPLECPDSSNTN